MVGQQKSGRRAVIVGGLRSPFAKAFTELVKLDTIELGRQVCEALINKHELPRTELASSSCRRRTAPARSSQGPYACNEGGREINGTRRDGSVDRSTWHQASVCSSSLAVVRSVW